MFKHDLLPRQELIAENTNNGRVYKTPIGPLPSVTTVINKTLDKTGLKKWRADIGEDQANQILVQSQVRGREVHDLCEKYVMNDPNWRNGAMPVNIETFIKFRQTIDKNIDTVLGLELPLWSKTYQTAGTADMVAIWQDSIAIVDYKTTLKHKTEEQCLGYMLQGTVYACLVNERYGLPVKNVVVMLAQDHEPRPIIHTVRTAKYWGQVKDIFITQRQKEYEVV